MGKSITAFVGGLVLGTIGLKVLASKDAKKVYTNVVAAGLRAKDCTLDKITEIQEEATDIIAEANEINKSKVVQESRCVIEDTSVRGE